MRVRCRGLCWSFLHVSVALIDHDTACAVFQIIHFRFFITMLYCGQGMSGIVANGYTEVYCSIVIYLSITQWYTGFNQQLT